MSKSKNAFIIVHFGDKIKYLELEIYLSLMIRKNSSNDIVYLYSINDTPISFVNIMKNYCNYTIAYDDKDITYDIKNFKSYYEHFNTLRTCNFLFAYQLTQYNRVCLIESDTIILKNIDDIFELKSPSILVYDKNINKIVENYKCKLDHKQILSECSTRSTINGGIILLKPSEKKYNRAIKKIKLVISANCMYPNETLFLLINKNVYNLPFKYNSIQYYIRKYGDYLKIDMNKYCSILHINSAEYKHIDIIRDNWLEKLKQKKPHLAIFIEFFKTKYYDRYNVDILKLLSKI
jgi:alpha-N-acetylglucosamine transferase